MTSRPSSFPVTLEEGGGDGMVIETSDDTQSIIQEPVVKAVVVGVVKGKHCVIVVVVCDDMLYLF